MPDAEPYLELGGVEVANSLRTLTYLRRGLGPAGFTVQLRHPLTPEAGYTDIYGDVYTADPYWPGNLSCYCSLLDTGPYVSPADDPAPWYDPTRPESADFLGMVPSVQVLSVLGRSVTPRAIGGTLGPQRLRPRLVQVSGPMYATSWAGMAWGERWLQQALVGELTGCVDAVLRLLPTCPPADAEDPASYWRTLAEVGLVDGPSFGPEGTVPRCYIQSVAWQLVAGQPHLWAPADTCLAEQYLRLDPTLCCVLEPAGVLGDAASRITLRAGQVGSTVTGVELTATLTSGGTCPAPGDPTMSYTVERLARGTELVIDAAARTVTVSDTDTGAVVGSLDALSFDGLFQWMVAEQGEQLCVCVDATDAVLNAGTLVLVERVGREL